MRYFRRRALFEARGDSSVFVIHPEEKHVRVLEDLRYLVSLAADGQTDESAMCKIVSEALHSVDVDDESDEVDIREAAEALTSEGWLEVGERPAALSAHLNQPVDILVVKRADATKDPRDGKCNVVAEEPGASLDEGLLVVQRRLDDLRVPRDRHRPCHGIVWSLRVTWEHSVLWSRVTGAFDALPDVSIAPIERVGVLRLERVAGAHVNLELARPLGERPREWTATKLTAFFRRVERAAKVVDPSACVFAEASSENRAARAAELRNLQTRVESLGEDGYVHARVEFPDDAALEEGLALLRRLGFRDAADGELVFFKDDETSLGDDWLLRAAPSARDVTFVYEFARAAFPVGTLQAALEISRIFQARFGAVPQAPNVSVDELQALEHAMVAAGLPPGSDDALLIF